MQEFSDFVFNSSSAISVYSYQSDVQTALLIVIALCQIIKIFYLMGNITMKGFSKR